MKVELNKEGVRALLRSQEMLNVCDRLAKEALQSLGEGYASDTFTGKNRVNASVYPDTVEATQENMDSNTVIKAVTGVKK